MSQIRVYLKDDDFTKYDYNVTRLRIKRGLLTPGKWYWATPSPVMYDPNTFQPHIVYLVTCDDGNIRKVSTGHFITQEEWRESKLNELGI